MRSRWPILGAGALVIQLSCAGAAGAQSTHYLFGGTGNAKPQLGEGANYMGPGNGFVIRTDGDVSGAEREAVPVLVDDPPAILTNFTVGLGGRPGSNRGYAFGVCVTREAANSCGSAGTFCSTASGAGTGVHCVIGSFATSCTDRMGSLSICDGDRLMVKGTKTSSTEPAALRVKWSFQLLAFD